MATGYDDPGNFDFPDGWGVESKTGPLVDVLVADPTHYRWQALNAMARRAMENLESIGVVFDQELAKRQHAGLVDTLTQAGVRVHTLSSEPCFPYSAYARDSSVMTPWGPMIMSMQPAARRREYSLVADFYHKAGIPVWNWITQGHLEGGDIVMLKPGVVLIGHTVARSEEAGAKQCQAWFQAQGWEALVVPQPDHFLHMDVTVLPCAPGLAVACVDALESYVIDFLSAHGFEILAVPYRDCIHLGCNVLPLGKERVLSLAHNTALNEQLKARGLTVLAPDLTMFTYGGGGVHCLTQEMRRLPD